jgi:hypothetical protein
VPSLLGSRPATPARGDIRRLGGCALSEVADFLAYDLVEAFPLAGCPLCRTLADDEERWMESFWREGRSGREARLAFYDGGGFCRRHAWLLHRLVHARSSGAAIADVYGALADRDLARLDKLLAASGIRARARLQRRAACSACVAAEDALSRKAYFLVELLRAEEAQTRYRESDGLCFPHLARTVADAPEAGAEVARFLVRDWRRRLADVRAQLEEFDRKRDVHHAHEPRGPEQDSWTEVIRLYVGEDRA